MKKIETKLAASENDLRSKQQSIQILEQTNNGLQTQLQDYIKDSARMNQLFQAEKIKDINDEKAKEKTNQELIKYKNMAAEAEHKAKVKRQKMLMSHSICF